jgi:hypothetical protein
VSDQHDQGDGDEHENERKRNDQNRGGHLPLGVARGFFLTFWRWHGNILTQFREYGRSAGRKKTAPQECGLASSFER